MKQIVVIAHNIRSVHNVGSLFRTCDGFGIKKLYLTGYTPYPKQVTDTRLPHVIKKIETALNKTALGAEHTVTHEHLEDPPLKQLKNEGFVIVGLEQDARAVLLPDFKSQDKIALLLGEEVAGIDSSLRDNCDALIEIPMRGTKESFNVSVAAGIALYGLIHAS